MKARTLALFCLVTCLGLSIPLGSVPGLPCAALADHHDEPTYRGDAIRLLEITGSTRLATDLGSSVNSSYIGQLRASNPDVPPRTFEIVEEVVDTMLVDAMGEELIEEMIAIYSRHFSHDDIRGLIAFYESPLGRKTISAMPAVMGESMQASEAWAARSVPRFQREVERRLAAEGLTVQ